MQCEDGLDATPSNAEHLGSDENDLDALANVERDRLFGLSALGEDALEKALSRVNPRAHRTTAGPIGVVESG
jgi:hypothetical protein